MQILLREQTKNYSSATGENISCRKGQRKRRGSVNGQVDSRQEAAAVPHVGLSVADVQVQL